MLSIIVSVSPVVVVHSVNSYNGSSHYVQRVVDGVPFCSALVSVFALLVSAHFHRHLMWHVEFFMGHTLRRLHPFWG